MKATIAIIGGGAAAISFATRIDTKKYNVCIFEKQKRLGSKLLVAGKGGFNLTHSEGIHTLKQRYVPSDFLLDALTLFDNADLRKFFTAIGIPTFVGSSKRVFPLSTIKPTKVVEALLAQIKKRAIAIHTRVTFIDFSKSGNRYEILLKDQNQTKVVMADFIVFALGGASWHVTGSTGDYLNLFNEKGIKTYPFQASNCAVEISWPTQIIRKIEGKPIKNIAITVNERTHLGEIMVTKFGIEGTPVYALSPQIRAGLKKEERQKIYIDFKPAVNHASLEEKLNRPQKGNWTAHVEKQLNLTKVQMVLLKNATSKDEFQTVSALIKYVKKLPLEIVNLAPIDEAISTVGGISLEAVNSNFELIDMKNVFVLGEMLNWDAPTGGYLIQACMSMGQYAANYLNQLK
jgi:uncharacterized flavoprotein (TIGR03862 family)